ncbi:MAG: hypothetical protein BGO55_29730 [Sphingobacteriales bacterium 50-39]|nr:RagB/SusD family nutrient uptake outer membrane protein [Sphingobacteriales bacterium]OJW60715.1 MAG: hypothetical protein BGO55_29730 [Sphingobacteriales bacterium 50-39]
MINKYFYRVSLLLALTIAFGACKKDGFLDVPPKGSLTDETTFSTESNADLFVNDIYNSLPDLNNEFEPLDQWTDNSHVGANWMDGLFVRSNSLNPANWSSGPGYMFDWVNNYTIIRKCNVFLQQVAARKSNFSGDWYTKRTGEVHFLRALFYSFLFENFGGVPLIAAPLNSQTQGNSIFVARSSFDSTLAFIEADCDTAASLLPLQPDQTGRATKGAAMTLKGAVELFVASPLTNPSNDPAKWAKAAASNLAVMNLGVYSLFPDYSAMFLAANNWNSEQIFCRGYALPSNGHAREGHLGPTIVNGTEQAWGNLTPTQNLVDDYLMSNGKPITDATSGYDPQHPYLNREKRFYQSIVYDSSVWQGYVIYTRIGGNNQIDLGSTSDIGNTGYYARKTLDESINGQTSLSTSPGISNYTYYRYAEVLLNYAEAQNEAVGPDQTVYDAVNAVRARSSVPAVTPGLSQADMRTVLHRERRIELAFEDKRWYDIRRWDITTKGPAVLTNPTYGMLIQADASGHLTYNPRAVVYNNSFSEYMNWLPIPESVMEQNNKLVQNKGY